MELTITNATIYIIATIIIATGVVVILNQTHVSWRMQRLEDTIKELNQHLENIEMRPRTPQAPVQASAPQRLPAPPQSTPVAMPVQQPVQPTTAQPVAWWHDQGV